MAIKISNNTVIDDSRQFLPNTISVGSTVGTAGSVLTSTGTGLQWLASSGFTVAITTFTVSGTFTKNPADLYYKIEAWGAGGSGAKLGASGNTYRAAGGGGGGAYVFRELPAAEVGDSVTITIGAGGGAKATSTTNGSNGGDTTVVGILTAYGGGGGQFYSNNSTAPSQPRSRGGTGGGWGSAGALADEQSGFPQFAQFYTAKIYGGGTDEDSGTPTGENPSLSVYGGGAGIGRDSALTFCKTYFEHLDGYRPGQGHSVYGGGGGACCSINIEAGFYSTTTIGGHSVYGGIGGNGAHSASATNGAVPGGGGGATFTGATSGAGGNGMVRITAYRGG